MAIVAVKTGLYHFDRDGVRAVTTTDDASHILVVDDDREIRESLCAHLERMGFVTSSAASAGAARDVLDERAIDLIILDIMMPGEDGLTLCRHVREVRNTPVILLTALSDDTDKIIGLEVGADDYVAKPFNPRELVARIKAVLRRAGDQVHTGAAADTTPLVFANWTLDEDQGELKRDDGVIVVLSTGELSLLKALLARQGETLSRDDLMQLTRGRETFAFERSIDNTIARLRKKIETEPATPRIIKTVRGGGYRLVSQASRT